jgi:diaminopropionate ammonia-lyase
LTGDLDTSAEMLSCGEASAPAIEILRRVGGVGIGVTEAALTEAVAVLRACGGPATTESGATGAAGLLTAAADAERRAELGIDRWSRVLLIATEGPVPNP